MKRKFIVVDTEDNACMLRIALGGRTRYGRMICDGFCGYELDEIKAEADRNGIKYAEGTTEEVPAY